MLINLCGPPTSGKSTIAKQFVEEFPNWKILSIDNYRREFKDEFKAWYELSEDTNKYKNVIVESSGTSWRLISWVLNNTEHSRRRDILTVIFTGKKEDFLARIKERKEKQLKEHVPFEYINLSEEGLVTYCEKKLPEIYKDDKALWLITDNSCERSEVYKRFKEYIAKEQNNGLK